MRKIFLIAPLFLILAAGCGSSKPVSQIAPQTPAPVQLKQLVNEDGVAINLPEGFAVVNFKKDDNIAEFKKGSLDLFLDSRYLVKQKNFNYKTGCESIDTKVVASVNISNGMSSLAVCAGKSQTAGLDYYQAIIPTSRTRPTLSETDYLEIDATGNVSSSQQDLGSFKEFVAGISLQNP
jgi:hypothetical protein